MYNQTIPINTTNSQVIETLKQWFQIEGYKVTYNSVTNTIQAESFFIKLHVSVTGNQHGRLLTLNVSTKSKSILYPRGYGLELFHFIKFLYSNDIVNESALETLISEDLLRNLQQGTGLTLMRASLVVLFFFIFLNFIDMPMFLIILTGISIYFVLKIAFPQIRHSKQDLINKIVA